MNPPRVSADGRGRLVAGLGLGGAALAAGGTFLDWFKIEVGGLTAPGGSATGWEGRDGRTVVAGAVVSLVAAARRWWAGERLQQPAVSAYGESLASSRAWSKESALTTQSSGPNSSSRHSVEVAGSTSATTRGGAYQPPSGTSPPHRATMRPSDSAVAAAARSRAWASASISGPTSTEGSDGWPRSTSWVAAARRGSTVS